MPYFDCDVGLKSKFTFEAIVCRLQMHPWFPAGNSASNCPCLNYVCVCVRGGRGEGGGLDIGQRHGTTQHYFDNEKIRGFGFLFRIHPVLEL